MNNKVKAATAYRSDCYDGEKGESDLRARPASLGSYLHRGRIAVTQKQVKR
jgi:hypothetical protein